MLDLIERRIRDNLHGSIDLSPLEDQVVAHPYFQRLRRIRQTAFLSLAFPGASHSRFEHSLGVMHLAGEAWNKIMSNQKRLKNDFSYSNNSSLLSLKKINNKNPNLLTSFIHLEDIENNKYCRQVLRLAALFHDVGHPAYSHTGEIFMPLVRDFIEHNSNIPNYLKKYLTQETQKKNGNHKQVSHEIYSIIIMNQILEEIYASTKNNDLTLIEPQDIASVLIPEIPPVETSDLKTLNLQNILHELVSGELDVDRMDYLLRDSKECGVVYGIFDVDRIMDSLAMYYHPQDDTFHLALKLSGLCAFEDYLRARQSMYLQVYLHKTAVSCEAMLYFITDKVDQCKFPLSHEEYCKLDDSNITHFIAEKIKTSHLSENEKKERIEMLGSLFFKRQLWKNIYEVSFFEENNKQPEEVEKIKNYLTQSQKKYKVIYSQNHLTKLTRHNHKNYNYLKLIHRDCKMNHTISPLDQYSKLYADNAITNILRIYVEEKVTREQIAKIINS